MIQGKKLAETVNTDGWLFIWQQEQVSAIFITTGHRLPAFIYVMTGLKMTGKSYNDR